MRSQASRLKAYARGDKSKDDPRVDLLDRFIHAKLEHPESMTDDHILRLGLSMIFAGSDSTSVSILLPRKFIRSNQFQHGQPYRILLLRPQESKHQN